MPLPAEFASPADIADGALRRLNAVGAGQSATAEDAALVTDGYQALHAELTENGLIDWPYEMCPRAAQYGIVAMLAARFSPEFLGVSEQEADSRERTARARFLTSNARPASAAAVKSEYF